MSSHSPSGPRVPPAIIAQCLALAETRGLQREDLLRDAGLNEADLQSVDGWLNFRKLEPMLRLAIERLQDQLIGLHAIPHLSFTMGLVGFALQSSSTLQELIETNIRLEPLLGDMGKTSISHAPGIVFWQWQGNIIDPLVARHTHECILGCQVSVLRLVRQRQTQPLLAVNFLHNAPTDPAIAHEIEKFFGCPVRYQQPCSALVLLASSLKSPLSQADPKLHQAIEQLVNQKLQDQKIEPSLCELAEDQILAQLRRGEPPTLDSLAALLGMSGRSLHRKLQDLGTSFREILDNVRLEMAVDLLRNTSLPIDAIATKLTFQESQSFIRWFRRHLETTPGDFRLHQIDKSAGRPSRKRI